MLKSILTTTINAQTTNNGLFLPLDFNFPEARILGVVSANKVDISVLISLLESEFVVAGDENIAIETPTDEVFYEKVKGILDEGKKFRFPVKMTLVILREDGKILILNWGGAVLLRRRNKTAPLTNYNDNIKLEVKAGKLQTDDILIIFNDQDEEMVLRLKDDLGQAQDWADFIIYSQAYLSQPEMENLGVLLLKCGTESKKEHLNSTDEMKDSGENLIKKDNLSDLSEKSEDANHRQDQQAVLHIMPEQEQIVGAHYIDKSQIPQIIEDETEPNPVINYGQTMPINQPKIEMQNMPISADEEKKPWHKITDLFKKKI